MSIESFVNRFNAALDESIRKAMEGPVTDSVKAAIVEAVQTEVYDAYERGDYMPYVRRDEVGNRAVSKIGALWSRNTTHRL